MIGGYMQTGTHLAVLEVSCFAVVGAGAWVQQGVVGGGQDLLATLGPLVRALPDPASSCAARTVTPPLAEHSAAHAHHVQSCIYHQNGSSLLSTCITTVDRMRHNAWLCGLDTYTSVVLGFLLDTQPSLVED